MIIVILFATSMMVIQVEFDNHDDDGENHDDDGHDYHGDNGDNYDVPHFPKMHVPGIPDPCFPP